MRRCQNKIFKLCQIAWSISLKNIHDLIFSSLVYYFCCSSSSKIISSYLIKSFSIPSGIEAAVWGETVRTADQMNSMLFPRLLAFAERAWHKAPWESITDTRERESEKAGDWERFANTLSYRELGRLDKIGVPYRVPPPAARYVSAELTNIILIIQRKSKIIIKKNI